MRLIDADAFAEALWCEYDRRELFMNECAEKGMWETRYGAKIERNTIAEIVHGMDEVPTIDAVPVVRCKDCRHYRTNNTTGYTHCEILKRFVTKDWFCAYGERKENV